MGWLGGKRQRNVARFPWLYQLKIVRVSGEMLPPPSSLKQSTRILRRRERDKSAAEREPVAGVCECTSLYCTVLWVQSEEHRAGEREFALAKDCKSAGANCDVKRSKSKLFT